MRLALLLCAAALAAVVGVRLGEPPASAAARHLDVVVVAGQSNALGFESYVIDPRTHHNLFTNASRSPADRRVLLTWDESGVRASGPDPVPLDTPQFRGGVTSPIFGPEVGLGRLLYADGHHHLLIVKVAMSGTSLAEDWLPGDADYRALLHQVGSATSWARANGWAPSLDALYWFQGESDAMEADTAAAYESNLRVFLGAVRSSLGLGRYRPVVVAQTDLAQFLRYKQDHGLCPATSCSAQWVWNREVMQAQAASAGPFTLVTRTAGLPRADRFIHLTDVAELALGRTFALLTSARLP